MRRHLSLILAIILLITCSGCFWGYDRGGYDDRDRGGYNGDRHDDRLPAVRFAAPPDVVVIPGTYVYMVPDIDVDILFFQGYWWRPYKGQWYRSQEYNGRWDYIETRGIPRGLRELPQDYRHRLSPRYERIPHRDVQSNWKKWEEEKYWDRRGDQDQRGYDNQDREGHDGDRHDDRR